MGCQSSKQTTITTPPPSSTHLPSHPLPTLYEEPSTEVEHVPRSPPPISTKSSSSSTPNHSNLSSPKQKNSLQSKPSHHSQVENRPIKLVGNLSNPILLQILQVVCSEKSYHESIHRIHIDKVSLFPSSLYPHSRI